MHVLQLPFQCDVSYIMLYSYLPLDNVHTKLHIIFSTPLTLLEHLIVESQDARKKQEQEFEDKLRDTELSLKGAVQTVELRLQHTVSELKKSVEN